ncbi:MAG TPA: outer membrane beta-barrel protein [Vicinamibacteria bacterium]|nr:outer membrane beta-barrel protein [Vicinamibacteria bacterium]
MRSTYAFVLVSALAASAAQAADGPRVTVSLNGVFAPSSITFESARTFDAFAEEGRIDASYDAGSGPGFEAGLVFNFTRSLGVSLAGGIVSRDTAADYTTSVPHPLFLNRNRTAEGTVDNVDYKESQVHLDLVYTGRSGSFDFSIFAGPTFMSLTADVLGQPAYDQSYPFETITVTNVPALSRDDTGFGFNAGAGVGYRFSDRVGVGVQGRFSRATMELVQDDGQDTVQIDAGGFQVAGGLRIYF